jgi:hypothetical protein
VGASGCIDPTTVRERRDDEREEAFPSSPSPSRPPPLTKEEKALIDADPLSLTPEKRRARAFVLRKKVLQNPDSPAARTLDEIRQRLQRGAGHEAPRSDGIRFTLPHVRPGSRAAEPAQTGGVQASAPP